MDKILNKYTLGFAFTIRRNLVLLMKRTKKGPQLKFLQGLFNGIGGKIKKNESPANTMKREGFEECGLHLPWVEKGFMKGINNDGTLFECHFFFAYSDKVKDFEQKEEGKLVLINPYSILIRDDILEDLRFLIPFGLSKNEKVYMNLKFS